MLKSLSVENFRAFERQQIEIRPITVILGPNNSGKSALLSAISVLAQTIRSSDSAVPLLLQGPLEDFGTYRDMVFDQDTSRKIRIQLKMEDTEGAVDDHPPEQLRMQGQEYAESRRSATFQITFRYRPQRREVVVDRFSLQTSPSHGEILAEYSDSTGHLMLDRPRTRTASGRDSEKRIRLHTYHFLPHPYLSIWFRDDEGTRRELSTLSNWETRLIDMLEQTEILGPLRKAPERTYLFSGERPRHAGVGGEQTVDILATDQSRRGRSKGNIAKKVSRWLQMAEVASNVKIDQIYDSARHFEVSVTHPVTGESVNLADAGYGCSQVLPVLVAGYNLAQRERGPSDNLIYIVEQPEIHLHPKAQAELGRFFLDLRKSGITSLVETHSEHMIVRIQSYIADPDTPLSPDDVVFYYVYGEGEGKHVKKMEVDETGTFTEEWPEGFFPQHMEEALKLARNRAHRAARAE